MSLSGRGKVAGVMGWPVAHSLSPRLHGHWLARYRIDGAYVPLAVRPEDFAAALAALPKLGFRGVNITLPHKEAALAAVDTVDETARRAGAVNTVTVDEDGRLTGGNTDGFGFVENLRAGAPGWTAADGPAAVLGAGGSSRAICAALIEAGAPEIRIANRTRERADALAEALGPPVVVWPWADREGMLSGAALLVNATQLGMDGQPPLEIALDALPRGAVVTDAVYAPLQTRLLTTAAERGHRTVDGLGMLIHQARPGFAAWFGRAPDATPDALAAARAVLLDDAAS
ncbi:MAG: shikimate dehydrogenase [Alphaproteobacteria bacterium]